MIGDPIAELLPEDVLRLVTGRRIGNSAPLAGCRVVGPVGMRPASRLFRCTAPEIVGAIALKFCLTPDGRRDFETARWQFAALERIAGLAARSAAPVRVVRAHDLIEEHACLVMEWIEGRSVASLLAGPMTADAEVRSWSNAAGRWLHDFHAMHRLAERPMSCAVMMANLDLHTPGAQALMANRSFVRGRAALEQTAPLVASIAVPIAHHHGDFKAENLMMTEDGLVGLDIVAHWDDAVTLDLAKFIRDLTFRSWRPTGWMLGRRYNAIVAAFLDGYGATHRPAWQGPLLWARLHGLLRFWIEQASAPPEPIRDSYERYRFEHCVAEAADALVAVSG
ncbi:MAG: phosphotransferase [Alphaproteobacteria bacterium]|nr:phosphotransferase [Alphaproteobacteria bacterium]